MPGPESEAARRAPSRPYVRDFNRFELKYLVEDGAARRFASDLEGYARSDPHSEGGGYSVWSVYWDSPALTFFWEKIDGEKYRRKLRFRRYGRSPDVFVEIKQRVDRTVQKRRVRWSTEHVDALFGRGDIDPDLESAVDDRVGMEALFLCRYHGLKPTIAVAYRRRAFVGACEPDLRITFDRRLQYDAHGLDPAHPGRSGKYLFDPNLVVVEIKFDNRAPLWLVKLVRRHGLELTRLSKYCSAVDRESFGGRFT